MGDRYLCLLLSPLTNPRGYWPIVQVKRILRYPIQHGIVWDEWCKENAPIDEDTRCRLQVFARKAGPPANTWEEARTEALRAAVDETLGDGRVNETEILLCHLRGDIRARRIIRAYTALEVEHELLKSVD